MIVYIPHGSAGRDFRVGSLNDDCIYTSMIRRNEWSAASQLLVVSGDDEKCELSLLVCPLYGAAGLNNGQSVVKKVVIDI